MDSNNDGIGDFKGITSKIPYLVELGINAVWISPFFESPNDDSGYDISDYYNVQKEFGTLDDLKEMVDEFHKNGIKVIFDLVANHTSSKHRWFQEAIKSKDNPYRDYYYWFDKPPFDWKSNFGGSAFEYSPETGQYYLHSFAVSQPDLNWTNPKVREEMKKVIDFWVDFGVDGFRCDVLDNIAKDWEKGLMSNGPKFHEYVHEIFGRDKTKNLYLIGECWSANEDILCDLISEERGELTASFLGGNVIYIDWNNNKISPNYEDIHTYFSKYQILAQNNNLIFPPFFENHDRNRSVSSLANDQDLRYESATFFATLLYTSFGTPFILQGEEFGTTNSYHKNIDEFNDVSCINFYKENKNVLDNHELMDKVNFLSRDHGRRPMVWDNSVNFGFNKGATPWLALHSRGKEINLENDLKKEKSIFNFYKEIINFRNSSKALIYGEYNDLTTSENYYKFSREYEDEKYIIICNYDKPSLVDIPINGKKVFSNYPLNQSNNFAPFEIAIYEI